MKPGLLVVGGSYAGFQVAASARDAGYAERITIVGEEPHLPYQRPPLSKGLLLGKVKEDSLPIRPADFFRSKDIELVAGERIARIDRRLHRAEGASGARYDFDIAVLACGARPRTLLAAGADHDNIHYLRSLNDARALSDRLQSASSVIVIGGGFIGLEVASAAAGLGRKATVLESAQRLLERAVAPALSDFLLRLHASKGVYIHLGAAICRLGRGASGYCVTMADGKRIEGDLVLAGIGSLPNVELAQDAGLPCDNGINVDSCGRTGDPRIFAIGDCSFHDNLFARVRMRLESVQNALDQGRAAGATIAGTETPYNALPRFWSDQYDSKLQMIGLSNKADRAIIRGSIDEGRFSVFLYEGASLVGVHSINRPADQAVGRRLLGSGFLVSPDKVRDLSFDLTSIVKAQDTRGAAAAR